MLGNQNNVLVAIIYFYYPLLPISTTQSAGAAHRVAGTVSQVNSQRPERAWFRHSRTSLFLNSPGKSPLASMIQAVCRVVVHARQVLMRENGQNK